MAEDSVAQSPCRAHLLHPPWPELRGSVLENALKPQLVSDQRSLHWCHIARSGGEQAVLVSYTSVEKSGTTCVCEIKILGSLSITASCETLVKV